MRSCWFVHFFYCRSFWDAPAKCIKKSRKLKFVYAGCQLVSIRKQDGVVKNSLGLCDLRTDYDWKKCLEFFWFHQVENVCLVQLHTEDLWYPSQGQRVVRILESWKPLSIYLSQSRLAFQFYYGTFCFSDYFWIELSILCKIQSFVFQVANVQNYKCIIRRLPGCLEN